MAISLPNIVIKPCLVMLFHEDCPLCAPLPYDSGTLKYLCWLMRPLGTRKWTSAIGTRQLTHETIGYPKMDISHWDAAIHYGVQLAQYCDQTRSFNAISRRSPPVYSLALTLRNTDVPVLTHESIGYPKMDISHWDAAIHYGIQLAQYYDKPDRLTLFHGHRPPCSPLP